MTSSDDSTPGMSLEKILADSRNLLNEERFPEAERLLRDGLAAFPDDGELNLRLATLCAAHSPDEAIQRLRAAVEVLRSDPGSLTRAGSAAFDLGFTAEAREWVKRAATLAGPDFPLAPTLTHIAGKLAWERGNLELAEQFLTDAFEADQDAIGHGTVLAEFLSSHGRHAEALRVLDRVHEADGRAASVSEARARISERMASNNG